MKCRARTADDEAKAYRKGKSDGIRQSVEVILTVCVLYLADKRGWKKDSLGQFNRFVNRYMAEIAENRIKVDEIRRVLKDEYDVEVVVRD